MLQVERDALLVRVQREEVAAVDTRFLGAAVATRIAPLGLFHLDDLCAQPREKLGARGTGLELRQVQHANAIERLSHRSASDGAGSGLPHDTSEGTCSASPYNSYARRSGAPGRGKDER